MKKIIIAVIAIASIAGMAIQLLHQIMKEQKTIIPRTYKD